MAIRIYRFFNVRLGLRGDIFALCDRHRACQTVPESCIIEVVGPSTARTVPGLRRGGSRQR